MKLLDPPFNLDTRRSGSSRIEIKGRVEKFHLLGERVGDSFFCCRFDFSRNEIRPSGDGPIGPCDPSPDVLALSFDPRGKLFDPGSTHLSH